jgi:hypothetical protein
VVASVFRLWRPLFRCKKGAQVNKIERMIRLGELIVTRKCRGFTNQQLLEAMEAFINVSPMATKEQERRIYSIRSAIADEMVRRGMYD